MAQKKGKQSKRSKKAGSPPLAGLTNVRIGFADRFHSVMPYGTYQQFVPGAGSLTTYSFRGNSVYDPDFTGGGTVAIGYAQLSTLYNRFRVVGSKITVKAANSGTSPVTCFIIASPTNSPGNAVSQMMARHMAQGTCSPGGPIEWCHTARASTAAIFGVPSSQVTSEDDFAGLVSANPNNVWYWHVSLFNIGTVAGAMNVQVRIDYDTYWSMPLNAGP